MSYRSKVIVAIDSYKGCLTSREANLAATAGIEEKMPGAEVVQIPVSDGGEGWLEAFGNAIRAYSGDSRSPIPMISVHSVGDLLYRRQN